MIRQRPARQARRVRHRPDHRPQPRLAQEPRQVQALPADVPAQGPAPRVGAGAATPRPRPRPQVPRAAHPLRRLLRARQGRARPGHGDRQDAERRRPQAHAPRHARRPTSGKPGTPTTSPATPPSARPTSRATTSPAGSTSATCTTTSAASRRSTRRSAACSSSSTTRGWPTNTLVVYSADQGFYLGEHGWFDKRWIFEESLRAPLLVRWPGRVKPGAVSAELVSNVDFAETFLDAAGLPAPADMQGRSLVPLLEGPDPGRLAEVVLLRVLRIPRPPPRPAALRRRHRPLQARAFLHARTSTNGSFSTSRPTRWSFGASPATRHTRKSLPI